MLPEYLPFPYTLPGGVKPGTDRKFEYRVPAAGLVTAQKLANESSVASNGMLEYKIRGVDI